MYENITITYLVASIVIGYLLGVISGLIPGIHTNNFALLLLSLSPIFIELGISPIYVAVAILSNSISHTFHDIIPAIFLGAPNDDVALAVLPGHRLLLDGYGAEAVRLSALGSAGSVVFSVILALPLIFFFANNYSLVQENMALILILISTVLIITEKGETVPGQGSLARLRFVFYALLIFLISGSLGYIAFRTEYLAKPILDIGEPTVLLPLLSGLFGASQLIISMMSDAHVPTKNISQMKLPSKNIARGIFTGSLAGSLVAWLPGVSSSTATVMTRLMIPENFSKEQNDEDLLEKAKEFIVSVSGVNTSNAIFGLFALAIIEKTRSGAMVAIDSLLSGTGINSTFILMCIIALLTASLFSYISTVAIGNNIHRVLEKIEYSKVCKGVLAFLCVTVTVLTGFYGLLLFVIATTIGMLPPFMKVRRAHAMGVILLPVILYFL
ncbi:putative membrane protein [Methanohalophilus levihalophilus]|uniref:tripartite tricarboxylate transporter permease n=1 Tax=Methanohalophilus levihalophilus TaxID=1431282 RepID=UPI001AEA664A|nr:tripartite tricarboxylate transporter permease [Methanohalophilus levihalophilus]MBP2029200.1 putative membrane protein [Methanohalophilus levihalophilus]